MSGAIFVIVGAALLLTGGVMLTGWVGGKERWFSSGGAEGSGGSKTDRMFVELYFLALVIAPLLAGATVLLLGLSSLL